MPSTPSKPTIDQCRNLAQRMLGYYGAPEVGDPKIFITGMIELMMTYSTSVVERLPSAVNGVPALFKFFPRIAEIKEALDKWQAEEIRHHETINRFARPALPAPERSHMPPLVATSTASAICARYGISGIPKGWDAVDVARAAYKYGTEFRAVVEKMLAGQMVADAPIPVPVPENERGGFWDRFTEEKESEMPPIRRVYVCTPELARVLADHDDGGQSHEGARHSADGMS